MRLIPKSATSRLKNLVRKKRSKPGASPEEPRVIFVSHEATRTGAPMIVLNLLQHIATHCNVHCETLLHSGGHLATEFQKYSDVECMNLPRESSEQLKNRVEKFVNRFRGGNKPVLAICNSMESRFVGEELASMGIPVIFLVHELPSSYTEEDYQRVFAYSQKVIFPAQTVREAVDNRSPIPMGKAVVLPQGLLKPEFGKKVTREIARATVIRELSIPEDAYIVLGCGTLDMRKGIDHFSNIARRLHSTKQARPIHFVWVGEGPRWTHSTYHYIQIDLEKSGTRKFVHFIGERADVEPYFVGADMFLMTSRVDPFPCVIHEAMAASLPILAFEGAGGATEAINGGAGITLPFADYDHACNVIRMLSSEPAMASSMRERSLERVHSRYRFADYSEKVIDLCESVARVNLRGRPVLRIMSETRAA